MSGAAKQLKAETLQGSTVRLVHSQRPELRMHRCFLSGRKETNDRMEPRATLMTQEKESVVTGGPTDLEEGFETLRQVRLFSRDSEDNMKPELVCPSWSVTVPPPEDLFCY